MLVGFQLLLVALGYTPGLAADAFGCGCLVIASGVGFQIHLSLLPPHTRVQTAVLLSWLAGYPVLRRNQCRRLHGATWGYTVGKA